MTKKASSTRATGTKGRGRTNITRTTPKDLGPTRSRPNPPITVETTANRPVSSGAKHRGDRRDMSPTYTTNRKHSARGSNPRKDVSTRAR